MKKFLFFVFSMNSFLLLFGSEQIERAKPYSLDRSIENASKSMGYKYLVLCEVEKIASC